MACFEVMEVSAKGCRVNGSLIHGLEAHATTEAEYHGQAKRRRLPQAGTTASTTKGEPEAPLFFFSGMFRLS